MKNNKDVAKEILIIFLIAFLHFKAWNIRHLLSHYSPIRELLVRDNIQDPLLRSVQKYIEVLRDNTFYVIVLLLMISSVFIFSSGHSKWFKYSIIGICISSIFFQFAINIM